LPEKRTFAVFVKNKNEGWFELRVGKRKEGKKPKGWEWARIRNAASISNAIDFYNNTYGDYLTWLDMRYKEKNR